tara:strand:- start:66 stop:425 length:360 start_codon:yes stop_codon:yes gene_type:complete
MKRIITIFIAAILLSSCATLFTGGKARVALNTPKQEGTTVSVNGFEKGQTPIQLKLKADDIITFSKEGYETKTVLVDSKFNTVAILNLFSILGWGIDAITESLKVPDSRVINVTLKESE